MHDAAFVRGIERVGDLPGNGQCVADRQRPADGGEAADHLGQRLTIDELEDKRVYAVMLLQPVDGGDVAMIERGKRPGFALESRQPVGIGSKRGWQDLQGHVSAKLEVVRAVDLAHPADAEERRDLIRAEVSASR